MQNIEELKAQLDEKILDPNFRDLQDLMDWFGALNIDEIESHYFFEDSGYCRIPLLGCDQYDLLLCCWLPGQESPFHGHPEQGCLVKILKGELTETRRFRDGSFKTGLNSRGSVAYINDSIGFHRVINNSGEEAVSLHLYAPGGYQPFIMPLNK